MIVRDQRAPRRPRSSASPVVLDARPAARRSARARWRDGRRVMSIAENRLAPLHVFRFHVTFTGHAVGRLDGGRCRMCSGAFPNARARGDDGAQGHQGRRHELRRGAACRPGELRDRDPQARHDHDPRPVEWFQLVAGGAYAYRLAAEIDDAGSRPASRCSPGGSTTRHAGQVQGGRSERARAPRSASRSCTSRTRACACSTQELRRCPAARHPADVWRPPSRSSTASRRRRSFAGAVQPGVARSTRVSTRVDEGNGAKKKQYRQEDAAPS